MGNKLTKPLTMLRPKCRTPSRGQFSMEYQKRGRTKKLGQMLDTESIMGPPLCIILTGGWTHAVQGVARTSGATVRVRMVLGAFAV
jgi:hypothetical protein